MAELQRELEDERLAQVRRAEAYKRTQALKAAEREAARKLRAEELKTGALSNILPTMAFRLARWDPRATDPTFRAVTLTIPTEDPIVKNAPLDGYGLGSVRAALFGLMQEVTPELARDIGRRRLPDEHR